jgi:hypothetical protein
MEDEIVERMIYFGSVEVFLDVVSGSCVGFGDCHEDVGSLEEVVSRGRVPAESGNLVVPAVPALNVVLDHKKVMVPQELSFPLIKSETAGVLKGWKSGVRSALVRVGTKMYRLKVTVAWFCLVMVFFIFFVFQGCGNNEEGFVLRTNRGWCDVRGCTFENTALRELYMASILGGANLPVAVARYDVRVHGVQPYCIVEETLGDRRLGTHVLAGLEILLERVVSLPGEARLEALFPPARPLKDDTVSGGIFSTGEIMMDLALGKVMWTSLEIPSCLANLSFCSAPLRDVALTGFVPQQWTSKGQGEMSDDWKTIWEHKSEEFNRSIVENKSVVTYLYSRIGFEGLTTLLRFFSFFLLCHLFQLV